MLRMNLPPFTQRERDMRRGREEEGGRRRREGRRREEEGGEGGEEGGGKGGGREEGGQKHWIRKQDNTAETDNRDMNSLLRNSLPSCTTVISSPILTSGTCSRCLNLTSLSCRCFSEISSCCISGGRAVKEGLCMSREDRSW